MLYLCFGFMFRDLPQDKHGLVKMFIWYFFLLCLWTDAILMATLGQQFQDSLKIFFIGNFKTRPSDAIFGVFEKNLERKWNMDALL